MSNDNWKMPEPIFQRTSGSLPEDFASRIANYAAKPPVDPPPGESDSQNNLSTLYAPPEETVKDADVPTAEVAPIPAIEEQPYISEQFGVAEIDTSTPVAPIVKGKGLTNLLLTIGLVVVLAIAAALVALIYFVFLRQPPETTFQ